MDPQITNTLQLLCASMMQQQSHNSHSNSNCCCPHHPRGPSARAAGAGHAVARDNKQHRSYAPPNDLQTWRMSVPDQSHIHANIQSQPSHKPRTRLMDQFPHKLQSTSSTNNTDNLECDNECADGYESCGGSSMLSVEPYHQQRSHRNKKFKKTASNKLKRNKKNRKRNRNRKKNRKNKNKNGRNRMYKRNKGKGKKIISRRKTSRSRSRNRVLSDLSGESSDSSDVNEWCDNNNSMYNYKRNKERDLRDLNELSDEDECYNNINQWQFKLKRKNKKNKNICIASDESEWYNNQSDEDEWYNDTNNNNNKKRKNKKNESRFIASDESAGGTDIDETESEKVIALSESDDDDDDDDDDDIQLQDIILNENINNFDIDSVFKEKELSRKLLKFAKKKAKKEGYKSVLKLVEIRINAARERLGIIDIPDGSRNVFEQFCSKINNAYNKLKSKSLKDGRKRKSILHQNIHYKQLSNNKCQCLVKRENGEICGKLPKDIKAYGLHWKRTHEFEWCYNCNSGHILDDD